MNEPDGAGNTDADHGEPEKQFLAQFPAYVIVAPPYERAPDGNLLIDGRSNFEVHEDGQGKALIAFTDRDSLSAYLERTGADLSVKVATPEMLREILLRIKAARGIELDVRFDCSDRFPGFHVPFDDVVG